MLYVNLHLGDWISSTRLLTATERGVYMDLLSQYYVLERPITIDECNRIARAYAPAEQDALHYVLQTFFVEEDGAYRHVRADREIGAVDELSEKRKRAAQARWAKKKAPETTEKTAGNAPAVQEECTSISTCNAHAMQSNNPNIQISKYPIESASALSSAPAQEAAPSAPKAPRRKAETPCPFLPGAPVPDEYRDIAVKAGVADPQRCFESFVMHALSHDRRLARWDFGFRTWCAKEKDFGAKAVPPKVKPLGERTAADYDGWFTA